MKVFELMAELGKHPANCDVVVAVNNDGELVQAFSVTDWGDTDGGEIGIIGNKIDEPEPAPTKQSKK